MRIARNDIPVMIEAPGAVARLRSDFGDATGFSAMSAEYFSLDAGTDITPLLQGLPGDACHSPHWGYMAQGALVVTYTDGSSEQVNGGDLFYWPPGHTVRVEQACELLMFSPQHEHIEVLDHMRTIMAAEAPAPPA